MSRDRTRTRDRPADASTDEFDVEFDLNDDRSRTGSRADPNAERGLRERAAERAGRLFSPRHFISALLLTVAGVLGAGTLLPLPGAGLLGIFVATFLFGLVVSERRYAETILAGALAASASTLLDFAVVAFLGGFGISLAALAGGLGAVVAGVGTYFGRDLRDGLTRDI
ncbi:MAG: hypothetical protein ACQET5_06770 [Halobacteriota archaeon]|uniref:hypothetical protein n=1 Tax=Natronomonas sp. TaxID=2184060 RepID=UPI003975E56A